MSLPFWVGIQTGNRQVKLDCCKSFGWCDKDELLKGYFARLVREDLLEAGEVSGHRSQ